MAWKSFCLVLPDWVSGFPIAPAYPSDEDKVRVAIELARRNVAEGTGGPFGAAVFEDETGRLVSPGVNMVVPARASVAHAEIVAITLAQQALLTHDLSPHNCVLATSVEPCAMCLAAIPWSGLRRVLCGAFDEDARAIGFDEGAKPGDWAAVLAAHGIEAGSGILRVDARVVLESYLQAGGSIYNPSK